MDTNMVQELSNLYSVHVHPNPVVPGFRVLADAKNQAVVPCLYHNPCAIKELLDQYLF